jgi:hypothetical protein
LAVEDVTGDGYPDLLAGNLGLNNELKPTEARPVTMWYNDYDKNGTIDPILCYYNGEKSYPLHTRDRVLDQMVVLKKKFTRHQLFAEAQYEDIFTDEQREGERMLLANTFEHAIFVNIGGKRFDRLPLPLMTQISVVRSFAVADFNQDGKKEIVTAGNFFGTDAQFGRYDASIGALLISDNAGKMHYVPSNQSGLKLSGDVRKVVQIGQDQYLVIRNNDSALLLSSNKHPKK